MNDENRSAILKCVKAAGSKGITPEAISERLGPGAPTNSVKQLLAECEATEGLAKFEKHNQVYWTTKAAVEQNRQEAAERAKREEAEALEAEKAKAAEEERKAAEEKAAEEERKAAEALPPIAPGPAEGKGKKAKGS
jgi:hypothetical protein